MWPGVNSYVGGLVGSNEVGTITNCYSTGAVPGGTYNGGLVGYNDSEVSDSFYYQLPDNGVGSFSMETDMTTETTYTGVGWDFTDIWAIDSTSTINSGFPYLQENPPTE